MPSQLQDRSKDTSKLQFETQGFEALHAKGELAEYLGQYVAVHQHRVIDHDRDQFDLALRVGERAREEGAILIRRVGAEAKGEALDFPLVKEGEFFFDEDMPGLPEGPLRAMKVTETQKK